jgi:hypothetical protein
MDEIKIRELLDKYWEGETSLEEERELSSYFVSSQVTDEFAPFIPLFAFFEEGRNIRMEVSVVQPPMEETKGKIVNIRWLISIAASIAIFLAVFFINKNISTEQSAQYAFEDTYQTPEEAYAEVKKALLYVSTKMNKGVSTAAESLEKMEPLDKIINN